MATELTAAGARSRIVDGLFPPVRTLVVGIDRLEMECRELREKHGAAILPAAFWARLANVMRARDAYLDEVER
jgi:hypothetical protein